MMTRQERVSKYMKIADRYEIGNSSIVWGELDKLSDDDLFNEEKVLLSVNAIQAYYANLEEQTTSFPENIMATIRQYLGLDRLDRSKDEEINAYTPEEAFDIVVNYEGLIGYTETIKGWIKDIYKVELE